MYIPNENLLYPYHTYVVNRVGNANQIPWTVVDPQADVSECECVPEWHTPRLCPDALKRCLHNHSPSRVKEGSK